jgi:hypothetical protein
LTLEQLTFLTNNMATSLSLENDSSLAQGYLKINGTTAATLTTSGITGNLVGNADTATKLAGTTGSAPSYACRAWVNFDGTRDTTGAVSTANTNRFIRSSGNVTSVLRNGAGDYTVTFTTAMSDANYAVVSGSITGFGNVLGISPSGSPSQSATLKTTSALRVVSRDWGSIQDLTEGHIAIFGN